MATGTQTIPALRAPRVLDRARSLTRAPALVTLGLLVGGSFGIRAVLGWTKATPAYFTDEYMYAALGRSLIETGRPLVRGGDAHFTSLLQPILTAPLWLVNDIGTAYHLVQTLGALAMSLAAVPVYLLARRLGLTSLTALLTATLTLLFPGVLYASWILAEPFAYPLALGAIAAATVAISSGSRRAQLAFLGLAGLAAFARAQLLVVPLCYVLAVLVTGARERRLRAAVREQLLVLGTLGAVLVVGLAAGGGRVLGSYGSGLPQHVDPVELGNELGRNTLTLAYASGWILIPGALLGLALALARPRSRAEAAFGVLATSLVAALLAQASLYGDVTFTQERYAFYACPLVAIAFGLYASRGWPLRSAHAIGAAALVALAASVPLTGWTASVWKIHSPFLLGAFHFEELLGSPGAGGLALAGVAGGLAVMSAALSSRPRYGGPAVLVLAAGACLAVSASASSFEHRNAAAVRAAFLPADRSWVDHAGVGSVTLLHGFGKSTDGIEQLFWNRSVTRTQPLPWAAGLDNFDSGRTRVGTDGTLYAGSRPLTGSVLVDRTGTVVRFRGARPVSASPGYRLWRASGTPRLAFYVLGWYADGHLTTFGTFGVWPDRPDQGLAGRFTLTVTPPPSGPATTLRLSGRRGQVRDVVLASGGRARQVTLAVCSAGGWTGWFSSRMALRSTRPRYVPDASACPHPRASSRA